MAQGSIENHRIVEVIDLDYIAAHHRDNAIGNIGSGDSMLILNCLPESMAHIEAFTQIKEEIKWNEMIHKGSSVPRLVSLQGTVDSTGDIPIYRHPADAQPELLPWSISVNSMRLVIEERIGQSLNHCLIQYYRSGHDFIGEHADKTLDICRGSIIVNLSLGCSRVMILKSKPTAEGPKVVQKLVLPNNSLFILGWNTNLHFTHEIKQDKRMSSLKRADELLCGEERISFTFRNVATFWSARFQNLYGQGATNKLRPCEAEVPQLRLAGTTIDSKYDSDLQKIVELQSIVENSSSDLIEEQRRLVQAFSDENKNVNFDWDQVYGDGFDILNFDVVSS
jgi:alkylated DNA repair dioxygenase AlkB